MIEAAMNGVLVSDPQSRTSKAGNPWLSFGISVGSGDDKQYVQIAVFGDLAKTWDKKLTKGSKVYVEGSLRISEYEKDGVKKFTINLACNKMDRTHMIGKQNPDRQKIEKKPSDHQKQVGGFDDEIPY